MYLILAAAGRGTRSGRKHNKVFAELAGKTVLEHCLDRVLKSPLQIVLVHSPSETTEMRNFLAARGYRGLILTAGGETRQASVRNALERIAELEGGLSTVPVGVHDAARCLVSEELLRRVYAAAERKGAAVPVIPVTDTIKLLEESGLTTLDRSKLRAAQTPQVARLDLLLPAHRRAAEAGLVCTDDAQILEYAGVYAETVEGEQSNFKLTYPEDFIAAEYFLSQVHES